MKKITEKILDFVTKLGGQVHLRSLRDAAAVLTPMVTLAGLMVLLNNLVFVQGGFVENLVGSEVLVNIQQVGNRVLNGTLNIWALSMVIGVSYCLAKNKSHQEPFIPAVVSLAAFVCMTPVINNIVPIGATDAVLVNGILSFAYIGTSCVFTSFFVALICTEIFIKLSNVKILRIKMSEMVPPMVGKSFSSLIPAMLTIIMFSILAVILDVTTKLPMNDIMVKLIQTPLLGITTSLPGFFFLMLLFNLFFSFGIHPTAIVGSIMDPALGLAMNENMLAFSAGTEIPHIITSTFRDIYGLMGGTGNTIALLIAIIIFSKRKENKAIASLSIAPGCFNINEPVIFGLPIVLNPVMMIPFILSSQITIGLAYFATKINLVNPTVVQVPWTTPPVISGYLATGGDIKAAILQIALIAVSIAFYLPFLKLSEKIEKVNV